MQFWATYVSNNKIEKKELSLQFFSFHLHSREGSECSPSFSLGEGTAGRRRVGNSFNTRCQHCNAKRKEEKGDEHHRPMWSPQEKAEKFPWNTTPQKCACYLSAQLNFYLE